MFENIINLINKPLIYVDFNKQLHDINKENVNIVALSENDIINDYFNETVNLYEGMEVVGFMEDEDGKGVRDDLFVEGIVIKNDTDAIVKVKWLLKSDTNRIRYISDILV